MKCDANLGNIFGCGHRLSMVPMAKEAHDGADCSDISEMSRAAEKPARFTRPLEQHIESRVNNGPNESAGGLGPVDWPSTGSFLTSLFGRFHVEAGR